MNATIVAIRSSIRIIGTKCKQQQEIVKRSFSSTAIKKNKTSQPVQEQVPHSLYFWGTSTKGTVPTKEVLESVGDGTDEALLDRFKSGSVVINTPTKIDVKDALGIGKLVFRLHFLPLFFVFE